jgi:hypothetical protein
MLPTVNRFARIQPFGISKHTPANCRHPFPLAFLRPMSDMNPGRLVVDEPLANRVRSGRKQPQRARHGSSCQPPTPNLFENRPGGLQIAAFCAPMLTCLCTLRFGARNQRFSPRRNDFQFRFVQSQACHHRRGRALTLADRLANNRAKGNRNIGRN